MAPARGVHPSTDPDSPPSARVLAVLEYLGALDRPVGPADIVRDLHITRSTARLILATLVRGGYAWRDETTGSYRPGPAAVALGRQVRERSPLLVGVSSVVGRLADELAMDAVVTARGGESIFVIERVGRRADVLLSLPGVRLPYAAPLGAAFAAYDSAEARERWLDRGELPPPRRANMDATVATFRRQRFYIFPLALGSQSDLAEVIQDLRAQGWRPQNVSARIAALESLQLGLMTPAGSAGDRVSSISLPVNDANGHVEFAVVAHVVHDANDATTAPDVARRLRAALDATVELVTGRPPSAD